MLYCDKSQRIVSVSAFLLSAAKEKPETGDKLFAENARAGQNTGAILQVEENPESGYDALAVIQIADTESKLFLNDSAGPEVTVKALPYSFETN